MYLQRHGQLVRSAQTPRTAFDRPSARGRLRPAVGQGPPPPPRDCSARPSRCWALAAAPLRMQVSEPGAASLLCNHRLVVAESPTCPPGHHGGEKRRRRSRHGGAGDRPATPPVKPPRLPPDHGAASRGRPTPRCCKSCPRPHGRALRVAPARLAAVPPVWRDRERECIGRQRERVLRGRDMK